jgi:redox-sensitive bicupin YhaK (pirin superfamily)
VPTSSDEVVLATAPLGPQWQTLDPFLFCAHHDDAYPAGNAELGPAASLSGRELGNDFAGRDGWRMYHGEKVPGFPVHPHCGFETVTLVRGGYVDHSDSLGATARFGRGDVQWLTAGKGIQHSEMFPLVRRDGPNPLEIFQIWLNLPRASKQAEPHFTMFWADRIPRHVATDAAGRRTEVTVVAGALPGVTPLPPPPNSWAANPASDVAIWWIRMAPQARWMLPPAQADSTRALYFFRGPKLKVAGAEIAGEHAIQLRPDVALPLEAGDGELELVMLQGRPIGEPVVQYGPFVGNTKADIQRAVAEYQRTEFGGWPWPRPDPVLSAEEGRFARHPDGHDERP